MYATDPFLFWVFVKAPVIFYRRGGVRGLQTEDFFSRGMTWFSGEIEGGSVVVNRVQRGVVEKIDFQ